jgi:hypothetical protein
MKFRKHSFRVGQKVRSVHDPKHIFEIDASVIPDRLFHEKGTDRWWQRNEMRLLGAPEKVGKSLTPKAPRTHSKTHPVNVKDLLGAQLRKYVPKEPPPTRTCPECGTDFKPRRKWQKFDKEACRRLAWLRLHPEAA